MKNIRILIRKYWFLFCQSLREGKFSEFLFIHWPTATIIFVVFLTNIVVCYKNISLSPHTPTLENGIYIVETLLRSVVILLSIIFSFSILSFQSFNKYFGRFAFSSFFKNNQVKVLFTGFILTVVFAIYTLAILKEEQAAGVIELNGYGHLLFFETLIMCIILVLSIFPVMIRLLENTQSRKNLAGLFHSINSDDISAKSFWFDSETDNEYYETNPLKVITEIGTVAIKEFDYTTFDILCREIYQYSKSAINSNNSNELKLDAYKKFTGILSAFFEYSAKERNGSSLLMILTVRSLIEKEVIKNDGKIILRNYKDKYLGWDFLNDIEKFFNTSVKFNEDESAEYAVQILMDYLEKLLKEYFPGRLKYDRSKQLQEIDETHIVASIYQLLNKMIKLASLLKKPSLFRTFFNFFRVIDTVIIESSNTKETKKYLLYINNLYKKPCLEEYVERLGVVNLTFETFPFGFAVKYEVEKLNTALIFESALKTIVYLFQRKALSNSVMNQLKAWTIGFLEPDMFEKNPEIWRKVTLSSLEKINHLRGLIKGNDTDDRKEFYINLEKYYKIIEGHFQSSSIEDEILKKKFVEMNNKFSHLSQFEAELQEKGYTVNPDLLGFQ